jgi:hypothetical protein
MSGYKRSLGWTEDRCRVNVRKEGLCKAVQGLWVVPELG